MAGLRLGPDAVVWLALAASTALLLFGLDRGFDLTDEAYYLTWIHDPARFKASIHPFGLPLHLVYRALGGSVVLLRLFGLVALLATGALLGRALGRFHRGPLDEAVRRRLIPFGALAGLSYYAFWVMTPNYNLLADASGAVILAGALGWAVADRDGGQDGAASLLVGFGGCIAFFAKPTFAALCAVVIAALLARSLWRSGRGVARLVTVALSCIVPLVGIVEMTVGAAGFLSSIRVGTAVLNYGNSVTSLPAKTLHEFYYGSPVLAINLTALVMALAWSHDRREDDAPAPMLARAMLGVVLLDLTFLAWNGAYGLHIEARPWNQLGLPTICLALGVVGSGLVRTGSPNARGLLPVLVLIAMPFAIAFGTANSLLIQTGMSLFAPLLALVIGGWTSLRSRAALGVELAAALGVPAMLVWSSLFPYDLPRSLYAQSERVTLPFTADTLRVDPETRRYVAGLRKLAGSGALDDCTPVVDLSGGGPGTALVLNDRAPFYPWLYHGFGAPGEIVDAAWGSMTPAQRSTAWIVGPVHPAFSHTSLAHDLIARQGRYRRAGTLPMVFWSEVRTIGIWRPAIAPPTTGCASRPIGAGEAG